MISEHNDNNGDKICKVWMIDVGSIVKHGNKISDYTDGTRAPEVDFGRKAGPEADVFSDAVETPLLLFGEIALKFTIPTDPKRDIYPAEFFSDSKFKSAKRHKVRAKENEYKKFGFEKPKFPKYFTNAQKMRYMYYHLGFLKIKKETGEIYPPEILDSLAKLQALSTEPDPKKRISERVVDDVLLNLMESIDQCGNGIYRIEGEKITPGSMTDEILPKNKPIKENVIQNKDRSNRMQNGIREIRLIRNDRTRNKKQDNDRAVWMNNEQRQDFNEKRNRAQNKGVNLNGNLPGMEQLLAKANKKANKNVIKINLEKKESSRRRYQRLNGEIM